MRDGAFLAQYSRKTGWFSSLTSFTSKLKTSVEAVVLICMQNHESNGAQEKTLFVDLEKEEQAFQTSHKKLGRTRLLCKASIIFGRQRGGAVGRVPAGGGAQG